MDQNQNSMLPIINIKKQSQIPPKNQRIQELGIENSSVSVVSGTELPVIAQAAAAAYQPSDQH